MKRTDIYIIHFLLFILIGSSSLRGQNYGDDIKKITAAFQKADISFHAKYCFYPFDSLKTITDSMDILCCMSGKDYYCKITSGEASYEYCKNSKYYFVIDHPNSAIAVKQSSDISQKQMWDISKVDSLVHSPGVKISYHDVGRKRGEYDIITKGSAWNKVKLIYDKSTYLLEQMCMYSSSKGSMFGTTYNKPMIEIYYSRYSSKQLDKNIFSERKFFYDTKDSLVLREPYKKYKLLDYIYPISKRS